MAWKNQPIILKNWKSKQNNISKKVIEKTGEAIPELIKQRLKQSGTTASGTILKTDTSDDMFTKSSGIRYAPLTIYLKGYYSPVDLNNTGAFYKSLKVVAKNSYYDISGNFNKKDGHIQKNFTYRFDTPKDFETDILNLNEEEKNIYTKKYFLPNFLRELRK